MAGKLESPSIPGRRPKILAVLSVGVAVMAVTAASVLVNNRSDENLWTRAGESRQGSIAASHVRVEFLGEVSHRVLFGEADIPAVRPLSADGPPEGMPPTTVESWLAFRYTINDHSTRVLIAKKPLRNAVSWDAIARSGAALGIGSVVVDGASRAQNATVMDLAGTRYRVRLPTCGRSTGADLSEWNLLMGAVHAGDRDFSGPWFGWIESPYSDADLDVGYDGSLSWCQELWKEGSSHRVVRGYFQVSRFHATESHLATDRIVWRPVLEAMDGSNDSDGSLGSLETSPDRRVRFFGSMENDAVFGPGGRLTDQISLPLGIHVDGGRPDWLRFELDGKALLVASKPLFSTVSWEVIAQAGAVLGDSSVIRIRGADYVQAAEAIDRQGVRYRVRLLKCGTSTLDSESEWNLLVGGVHAGDGDFRANRDGRYGWIAEPLSDDALHIGERLGASTWCQERELVAGRQHAVNRGYLTVSRFHLTDIGYADSAFGWRPVLERIPDQGAPSF